VRFYCMRGLVRTSHPFHTLMHYTADRWKTGSLIVDPVSRAGCTLALDGNGPEQLRAICFSELPYPLMTSCSGN
jgi:hypothetical protein